MAMLSQDLHFPQDFSSFPGKAWLATFDEGVYGSDSWGITNSGLKIDEVMHSTMMEITRKHHPPWPGFDL